MTNSRRYLKSTTSAPSWIERTSDAILMCHYCGTSGNIDDKYYSTEPCTKSLTIRKYPIKPQQQQQQPQQYEKPSFPSSPVASCWLWSTNNEYHSVKGGDDFIEMQYGVSPRNLQEDYELQRVWICSFSFYLSMLVDIEYIDVAGQCQSICTAKTFSYLWVHVREVVIVRNVMYNNSIVIIIYYRNKLPNIIFYLFFHLLLYSSGTQCVW